MSAIPHIAVVVYFLFYAVCNCVGSPPHVFRFVVDTAIIVGLCVLYVKPNVRLYMERPCEGKDRCPASARCSGCDECDRRNERRDNADDECESE